jgi:retron-type reverse transcriptase
LLDADIQAFFDTIDHAWMMKFVEHRIADPRVLRLIQKWLRAGVSEGGEWSETTAGTPQGAVVSPLLSNVYLHYVLDLWVNQWRGRHAAGDVIAVRYADDFVMGSQHRREAERFLADLKARFQQFGLGLHPVKTRLIEFGRFADQNRRRREGRKPAGRPAARDVRLPGLHARVRPEACQRTLHRATTVDQEAAPRQAGGSEAGVATPAS